MSIRSKIYIQPFGVFFGFILFAISVFGQQQALLQIDNRQAIQDISLNGAWQFYPIEYDSMATSMSIPAIDSLVKNIDVSNKKSFDIKVPQFLNHVSWWLPNVSAQFEQQEDQRMASFPFEAKHVLSGLYRKDFVLDNLMEKGQADVYINFEGVAMISRVYCNGYYVGGHLGMFGSFNFCLTPYLNWGKTNTLSVYVERGSQVKNGDEVVSVAVTVPVTRDMLSSLNAGMFGGFGNGPRAKFMGIWQPVNLKVSKAGGRIKDVFFNPSLQGHRIAFTIENPGTGKVDGKIIYSIKDYKSGKLLLKDTLKQNITVNAGKINEIIIDKNGLNPKLWTPDEPNLYTLEVHWINNKNQTTDIWVDQVGYRTISVKGQQIYLNGKRYWIRGAGMPPYGYKSNDSMVAQNFLKYMHDGNEMVTRTGCNPWNNMWYTAADKIGVGVSSEGVRPWALMSKSPPPPASILEHWKAEQLESVKQYRNHPSILFYAVSNEGLQGDAKNPQKLAIFKDIIDAMRKLDPSRPIIQTSGDPDHQGIADIEDVHSYWGWYESSSYVNDYSKPMRGLSLGDGRPFLNEECAIPYSSTDNGKTHPNYVGLYSAQPWVGDLGVFGDDPSYYQEHIRAEAKMKSEKLRYSRKKLPTAGFLLFANVTWIQHALSKPANEWKPFPVYYAVKQAFQPVLVALQTTQRVFYTGEKINSTIYVVNDDSKFKDLNSLTVIAEISDSLGKVVSTKKMYLGNVSYFDVKSYPFSWVIPDIKGRNKHLVKASISFRLINGEGKQVSQNTYMVRFASPPQISGNHKNLTIAQSGCNNSILSQLRSMGSKIIPVNNSIGIADIVLLGAGATNIQLKEAKAALKPGGRIVVLEQGAAAKRLCEDVYLKESLTKTDSTSRAIDDYMYDDGTHSNDPVIKIKGEFVEMLQWENSQPLFDGLDAMDWKWWMQGQGLPALVCTAGHKIDTKNKSVIPIGKFLLPHFYWTEGNLNDIYKSKISYPVFAVRRDWGTIIICDLMISESLSFDPRAGITLTNLMIKPIR
ncbi:MAG: glycoside hydrolase family 2 TIM barrel-domain containing protein [Chitinophagaceae bacterium]